MGRNLEVPELPHLAQVGPVDVGGVCEGGDLVHLLPEAERELPRHGAGEGQAEGLACM